MLRRTSLHELSTVFNDGRVAVFRKDGVLVMTGTLFNKQYRLDPSVDESVKAKIMNFSVSASWGRRSASVQCGSSRGGIPSFRAGTRIPVWEFLYMGTGFTKKTHDDPCHNVFTEKPTVC